MQADDALMERCHALGSQIPTTATAAEAHPIHNSALSGHQ